MGDREEEMDARTGAKRNGAEAQNSHWSAFLQELSITRHNPSKAVDLRYVRFDSFVIVNSGPFHYPQPPLTKLFDSLMSEKYPTLDYLSQKGTAAYKNPC